MRNLGGRLGAVRRSLKIRQKPAKPPDNPKLSHRFLTTAIAKIPLSVAPVKHEPQYVVFSCACDAPTSATPPIGCAKRQKQRLPGKFRRILRSFSALVRA
jgi:hypothetical protein